MSVESQPAAPDADVQPPEVTFSHGGPSAVLAALYQHMPGPDPCTACGSTRLIWRVKRERPPGTHPSRRALLWTCLDCGAEREEPLSGEPEAAPLTAD